MRWNTMPVQFVACPSGDRLVVIPEADYMRLIAALDRAAFVGSASRNGSNETNPNLLYTAPEVAERLRVSEVTLARWRSNGKGPKYIKYDGRVVYREADLREYEDKNTREGTRPCN